jgi:hypothetical protein
MTQHTNVTVCAVNSHAGRVTRGLARRQRGSQAEIAPARANALRVFSRNAVLSVTRACTAWRLS